MNAKHLKHLSSLLLVCFVLLADVVASAEGENRVVTTSQSLAQAADEKAEHLLAQTIGDKCIASGTEVVFARYSKDDIEQYINKMIVQTGSAVGEDRAEANQQIQRLWRLCVPKLMDNLGHPDPTINEAVMKNLILMRNEEIIEKIIKRISSSSDPRVKQAGVFVLGMMKEERSTLIANRQVLDATASEAIATDQIRPFLDELNKSSEDPSLKKLIENAKASLTQ